LGATSGVLAALGCELISALLYRFAFDLTWNPHPWLLLLPVLGALLIGGAGMLGTRCALNACPLQVLREGCLCTLIFLSDLECHEPLSTAPQCRYAADYHARGSAPARRTA